MLTRGLFVLYLVVLIACQHQPGKEESLPWQSENDRFFGSEWQKDQVLKHLDTGRAVALSVCPSGVENACELATADNAAKQKREMGEAERAFREAGFQGRNFSRQGMYATGVRNRRELQRLIDTGLVDRIIWEPPMRLNES